MVHTYISPYETYVYKPLKALIYVCLMVQILMIKSKSFLIIMSDCPFLSKFLSESCLTVCMHAYIQYRAYGVALVSRID